MTTRVRITAALCALLLTTDAGRAAGLVDVQLSGFKPSPGLNVEVDATLGHLRMQWPVSKDHPLDRGRLDLNLDPEKPRVGGASYLVTQPSDDITLLGACDPVFHVTVGTRENPPGRPPGMSVFNAFFDSPAQRPHETFAAAVRPTRARVTGRDGRATVAFDGLTAGPFSGELRFTVYSGSNLVHVEAVVSTRREKTAFVYDAGLATVENPVMAWKRFAWRDTEGTLQTAAADTADRAVAAKHRALAMVHGNGAVAAFPPPHQFFYPRDRTDNQRTAWYGRGHRGTEKRLAFGVRQTETGGGAYVPWFNAPPGTEQRLGVFFQLLPSSKADDALDAPLPYTRGDRYADLPGHVTFSSHWHMATAVAAMKETAAGKGRTTPDLVKMFKDMNVRVVHLAEFHGDGHPADPGPLRLPEMKAMFDECRRLSDDRLTFLPGEEANAHLGVSKPGQHPGHWLYLFPKPVYWTMNRKPGQPFAGEIAPYGKVYHAGDQADVLRLLETEKGLAWTAHPRIKASNWAPDAYRDAPYYTSPVWLGGAWKAMPADLSRPKLGERVLDLLDDMANWGPGPKYALGEVDVFQIDHTHELFGHMNVNYLRLDRAPKYDDDWTPLLDALRGGKFFVTTGEVLLTRFDANGVASGGRLTPPADGSVTVTLGLDATFPLAFAEVVSGDGSKVYRDRIDLADTPPFAKVEKTVRLDLTGRKWLRVEAWDVAANGAFSQPVWMGK